MFSKKMAVTTAVLGSAFLTLTLASPASASQPPGGGSGSCGDSISVSTYHDGSGDFRITVKSNPIGCQIRAYAHCHWAYGASTFYETGNVVTTSGTSNADCGLDERLYGVSGYEWNDSGTWIFKSTYTA